MGIHFHNLRLQQMHFHKIYSYMHVSKSTILVTVGQLLVSFSKHFKSKQFHFTISFCNNLTTKHEWSVYKLATLTLVHYSGKIML